MRNSRMSSREALEEARKMISGLKGPKTTIQKVMALLRVVESELPKGISLEPMRRGKTPLTYVVERTALGETLAELRPEGSSQPFRCPKPLYDAMVGILVDAEKPMSAEEIADAVEKRIGVRPADHQFRVPLRLWSQIEPPLLIRSRAKYRVADPTPFKRSAEALWNKLRAL
jgi:hypothetical protein